MPGRRSSGRELVADLRADVRRLAGISTGALLLIAVAALLLAAAGLASGRWKVLPVLSGSMEPSFGAGDLVVAKRAPLRTVAEGDVIVYEIPIGDGDVTAHRVVDVTRKGIHPVVRTKGDANAAVDPWTAELEGPWAWKVEADVPLLGHLLLAVRRPWVQLALLWAALGLALAAGLRAVWRRGRILGHA